MFKAQSIDTDSSARPRKPVWLALLATTPIFCCTGCLLLYFATSPCSLSGQWYDFLGGVPVMPLPPDAQLLSERGVDGKPIFGGTDADDEYYSELYATSLTSDVLVAFCQARRPTGAANLMRLPMAGEKSRFFRRKRIKANQCPGCVETSRPITSTNRCHQQEYFYEPMSSGVSIVDLSIR
jgi:hypothetical protein